MAQETKSPGRGESRGGGALTWATQMERCLGYIESAEAVSATWAERKDARESLGRNGESLLQRKR
jgi:hypothetical protein